MENQLVSRRTIAQLAAGAILTAGVAAGATQPKKKGKEKKATFEATAAGIRTYEKVSKVIGSEFDKAFKNIMTDLAAGDVSLIDDDGEEVALDDLKVFFEYCGGGEMGLDFRCNAQKNGKLVIYAKEDIPVDASLSLVSGEITFGGTIRF